MNPMTYKNLSQIKWELEIHKCELQEEKPHPEVLESVKNAVKENGSVIMPLMVVQRPDGMTKQEYDEAVSIFKDCMSQKRAIQISAIGIVMDMIEQEILPMAHMPPFVKKIVHVDAAEILKGPPDDYKLGYDHE